jgi:hypothetical protein
VTNETSTGPRAFLACATSALALIAAVAAWAFPGAGGSALAAMAPVEPYLMANRDQEIALARSAAPASVSAHADVMVLDRHGYVTAVKGTNGFVCLVVRSWDNELDSKSAVFWNPQFRAPFCLNPSGAQYALTLYLLRTRWAIAGASEQEMAGREKAAWAAGRLQAPKAGAMCYMMSRLGNLGGGSAWHSHVMFYVPNEKASGWGANLPHVPVMGAATDHATVFFVIVPFWSDGTPESGAM